MILGKALLDKNIKLQVSNKAKQFIIDKGSDLKYGARPLRRAIQRYIEDKISDLLLKGEISDGKTIKIDIDSKNEELIIL